MTNSRAIVYACPDKGLFPELSKVSSISSYRQTLFKKQNNQNWSLYHVNKQLFTDEQLHKPTELKTMTMTS